MSHSTTQHNTHSVSAHASLRRTAGNTHVRLWQDWPSYPSKQAHCPVAFWQNPALAHSAVPACNDVMLPFPTHNVEVGHVPDDSSVFPHPFTPVQTRRYGHDTNNKRIMHVPGPHKRNPCTTYATSSRHWSSRPDRCRWNLFRTHRGRSTGWSTRPRQTKQCTAPPE